MIKATAKKIKGEWIAEVEDWNEGSPNYGGTEHYSIVSTSEKEYLEKNQMEGKEIEGDCLNTSRGRIIFYLHYAP